MALEDPRRLEACRMYLEDGLSCSQIASHFGVSTRTIERWAKADEWSARLTTRKMISLPARAVPATIRAEPVLSEIDELSLVDRALAKVSTVLDDSTLARDVGTCATALCKLIELRLELKPRTAAKLAEMAIELGITPGEFVAELKRHWAHERAA